MLKEKTDEFFENRHFVIIHTTMLC